MTAITPYRGPMTRSRRPQRDEFLSNFLDHPDCDWGSEATHARRLLDGQLVDAVVDPRLGERPEQLLLVSLAGGPAARRLAQAVTRVTVFDPSGLEYLELPPLAPDGSGLIWAQGPGLADLPAAAYDVVAIDHVAVTLFPNEVDRFVNQVRRILRPGGRLVLLNAHRPLEDWSYDAASLRDAIAAREGQPILEVDLDEHSLGVWLF